MHVSVASTTQPTASHNGREGNAGLLIKHRQQSSAVPHVYSIRGRAMTRPVVCLMRYRHGQLGKARSALHHLPQSLSRPGPFRS